MQVFSHFHELSGLAVPVHWAMGFFDGVHMGHRFIINSARQARDDHGGLLGVFTFDRHPRQIIRPDDAPLRILADEAEKQLLLREQGVDVLLNLHFTREIAMLDAKDFLALLEESCSVGSISAGTDWRFGQGRSGDMALLEQVGRERGFSVYAHPHVLWNGERISSTRIRRHLELGDLDSVRAMLGRPYMVTGTVIRGRQLGRQLGFPTANVKPCLEQTPPPGVYAVKAHLRDAVIPGIANLGLRPTISGDDHELLLEVHLFDFDGDLYGMILRVEFVRLIRQEVKFDTVDDLRRQIALDIRQARHVIDEAE